MKIKNIPNNKQSGMATLMISVILLTAIGLMSVYTAQISVVDQRVSSNHYRAKQGFEAAQAGLDNVINTLNMRTLDAAICTGSGTETNNADVCYTTGPATGTGTQSSFTGSNSLATLTPGGSQTIGQYTLSFNQHPAVNGTSFPNMVQFSLSGFAGDNTVGNGNPNVNITQSLIKIPILNYAPPAPIIAREDYTVNSATTTVTSTAARSWCGRNNTITGIDSNNYSLDSQLLSTTLSTTDLFFENFFSEKRDSLKVRSEVISCLNDCDETILSAFVDASGNPTGNNILWIDANNAGVFKTISISNAIKVGAPTNPVLLIVDGIIDIQNIGAEFFGVIYTTQTFGPLSTQGNITGAIISEQSILLDTIPGPFFITHDLSIFDNMDADIARFTRVSGSWKDF